MSIGNLTHTCRWILTLGSPGVTAKYCEKPVGWTVPLDDDGNPVRCYNTFCTEHIEKARLQELQEKEDDGE